MPRILAKSLSRFGVLGHLGSEKQYVGHSPLLRLPLSSALPELEPLGQRQTFSQSTDTMINGIVVAPHHFGQDSFSYTGFNILAIKPQLALNIEAIGATGHWALGIDHAGTGRLVQQGAHDRA